MKKAKPQDIVYQYVKNQIIGKSMFPGNRIIEDDIIRETGTSRTSIRPALLRLKYEGPGGLCGQAQRGGSAAGISGP